MENEDYIMIAIYARSLRKKTNMLSSHLITRQR